MVPAAAISADITITNELGLHLRAAGALVQVANQFTSEITIERGMMRANGKSIMGLLSLAASKGTALRLHAQGEDAQQAIEALVALITRGFTKP